MGLGAFLGVFACRWLGGYTMGLETQSVSFCVAGIAMFCTGGVGQVAQNGGKIPRFCIVSAIIAESRKMAGFQVVRPTTTTKKSEKNQTCNFV